MKYILEFIEAFKQYVASRNGGWSSKHEWDLYARSKAIHHSEQALWWADKLDEPCEPEEYQKRIDRANMHANIALALLRN